ncbi:serine--tRNA ligase-like protein [Tanacetum coccineum]|uniref:Serine--tRNA ligase-like protein n=1 Tax=Tanacetum coccineum TaxID=301880 RepID=A0ABQ5GQ50_9ASTR
MGLADMKIGAYVAGNRGYYLKGAAVRLNQALINFALEFLQEKGYEALQPPIFMTKDVMSKCAQLGSLEEELYKVKGDDQYLIATAEQPICASHKDDLFGPKQLPIRMRGMLDIHLAFVKRPVHMVKTLLKLPYQVVAIVSGALNDATAKKYDLEAWFPASAKN